MATRVVSLDATAKRVASGSCVVTFEPDATIEFGLSDLPEGTTAPTLFHLIRDRSGTLVYTKEQGFTLWMRSADDGTHRVTVSDI